MFARSHPDKAMAVREVGNAGGGRSAFDTASSGILSGAEAILYAGEAFQAASFPEALRIRNLCRCNQTGFWVADNILLARALGAEGVLLSRETERETAREVLGPAGIVGLSIKGEAAASAVTGFDFVEWVPDTSGQKVRGRVSLMDFRRFPIPVLVRWGEGGDWVRDCIDNGAAGVVVREDASRAAAADSSFEAAAALCRVPPNPRLLQPWKNEFSLIEKLIDAGKGPGVKRTFPMPVPPGDDACLLGALERPVISTDTQREGVHFRLDWQRPEEVGEKAVVVALSDLAASYADPVAVFINLTLPHHTAEETVERIYRGVASALAQYGCSLGGGNVSAGEALSLDLFVVGECWGDAYPCRANAQKGDGLYVTGPIGLSRAGLEALRRRDPKWRRPIEHFKKPRARFDYARVLWENGVSCVIDLSDGLAGDAGHIAKASGVAVELNVTTESLDRDLVSFCRQYGYDAASFAASGGEEYELLFTCRPDVFKRFAKELPQAHAVGKCAPFSGSLLLNAPSGAKSFEHGN